MKARKALETRVLRCLIAALDNAGAIAPKAGTTRLIASKYVATGAGQGSAEAARRLLSADEVDMLIAHEVVVRQDASAAFDRCGQPSEAQAARAEMAVVARYRSPVDDG